MLVLHVISSMDPREGGVCQAVRTMIAGMTEFNVENEVVCLDTIGELFLTSNPYVTHALGPARGPWAYSAQLIPWLFENLARFDSVIIHGLWQYHGYATRKALNQLRLKAVKSKAENPRSKLHSGSKPSTQNHSLPKVFVMPHGMLDPYFQSDPDRRVKAIRNWCYWKLIESKVVNQAAGLLFTCEEERLLARKPFKPYSPKNESVVGLGVEEPPVRTDEMQVAFLEKCSALHDRSYLLFLSRIHPKKGVNLLIRAYADLAKSYLLFSKSAHCPIITLNPSPFPSLVIAGPLDSAYAKEMQALAEELLPSSSSSAHCSLLNDNSTHIPSIHFPGMLRGDAKWGAFYGCEAFILPSHQENFGIAVVEALACGKPVLISNKVNIWREIVVAGAGIAAADNAEGTNELLSTYLSLSDEEQMVMNREGLECYRDHFQIKAAASKITAIVSTPVTAQ